MDLVKVAYKGGQLYVKDWNKLIARKDYIVPSSLTSFTQTPFNYFPVKYEYYKQTVKERMLARKEKYIQRGFQIRETYRTSEIIKRNYNIYSLLEDKNEEIMEHISLFHFNDYLNPKV